MNFDYADLYIMHTVFHNVQNVCCIKLRHILNLLLWYRQYVRNWFLNIWYSLPSGLRTNIRQDLVRIEHRPIYNEIQVDKSESILMVRLIMLSS